MSGGQIQIEINDSRIDVTAFEGADEGIAYIGVDASDLFHLAALFNRAYGRATARDTVSREVSLAPSGGAV